MSEINNNNNNKLRTASGYYVAFTFHYFHPKFIACVQTAT